MLAWALCETVITVCFNCQRESLWRMKTSFSSFLWEPRRPSTSGTWEPRSAGGRWVVLRWIFINHSHYHTSTPKLVSQCPRLPAQRLLHSPPGSAFPHLPSNVSTFSEHIISLTQFAHQMLISQPAVGIQLIQLALWSPAPWKSHKLQSLVRQKHPRRLPASQCCFWPIPSWTTSLQRFQKHMHIIVYLGSC